LPCKTSGPIRVDDMGAFNIPSSAVRRGHVNCGSSS
jgi:hypothetical protein